MIDVDNFSQGARTDLWSKPVNKYAKKENKYFSKTLSYFALKAG